MTIENKSAAFEARDFVCMRIQGVIVKTGGRRLPRRAAAFYTRRKESDRGAQVWGVLNLK